MNNCLAKITFNKNKSKISGKNAKNEKNFLTRIVILTLVSLLISLLLMLFSVSAAGPEPSLELVLNDLGFTNISLANIETFPSGIYNSTLLAELARCYDRNLLSYYVVGSSDYQTIFAGPEGATGIVGGYVVPPVSKMFEVDSQFGLSMRAPVYRYFTEHSKNPDYPQLHARVYENLDSSGMLLIGFEGFFGESDMDYNDMVFSLVHLVPPEITSVTRSPQAPNYDQSVTITAQVAKGSAGVNSVILSYQVSSGSWTNVSMALGSSGYVASIPAQAYGTAVNYKVYASDALGQSVVSALYSYIVDDFVSPVISNVVRAPITPTQAQSVKVSATVTEPLDASGVKNITLWYTNNIVSASIPMAIQGDVWTANIPGQTAGNNVNYFIDAFDNAGNSAKTSTFSYTIFVPNVLPTADFVSASPIFTGDVVNFNASASYDPDGYITTYFWTLGDGTFANGVNLTHSYVENGVYPVTLTVTDNRGATASKTVSVAVNNRPPVADFTASATILDKEEVVTFDASASFDSDGTIVAYAWTFGDGTTATGVSVSYSYSTAGSYTVSLTVTDDDGATDTITATKTVRNNSPVVIFTESAETVYADDEITFNAADSYDPDGVIVAYAWTFGDGTTATGVSVSHAYADNGSYVVTLTVTDNDGSTDSLTKTITAMNNLPVAMFTAIPEVASNNEVISFDSSESYDSDGIIVDYSWDFGDGTIVTGVSVSHAYSQTGTFTVTLTVTDDDGATDSASLAITVSNVPPVASFTESAEIVSSGESISFDASASYDIDGTIVSYSWDFGDGTTATGVTSDHKFTDNGEYTVTLTVTDDNGATGLATSTSIVLNRQPVAAFTANPTTVTANETINFDASASYDLDGTIVTYLWEFGDGNTATGITVDYAYTETGDYTVTLTVTDNDGDSTSETTNITVIEMETETTVQLAILSVVGLGIATLTATLLYGLFIRRKKKRQNED